MNGIRVTIDESARKSLKDDAEMFSKVVEDFSDVAQANEFLIERYGMMPGMRNKVYIDTVEGRQVVGFTHSYWMSSVVSTWFQTDWVMATDAAGSPVLLG